LATDDIALPLPIMDTSTESISFSRMNIQSSAHASETSAGAPRRKSAPSPAQQQNQQPQHNVHHYQQQLPSIQQVWLRAQPQHHPAHLAINPPNMLSTEPPDLDQEDDEYDTQQGGTIKKTEKAKWTLDEVLNHPLFPCLTSE
jgi:hypothetical protein